MAKTKLISFALLLTITTIQGLAMATPVLRVPRANSRPGREHENGHILAVQKHDHGLQSTRDSDPECAPRGRGKSIHSLKLHAR